MNKTEFSIVSDGDAWVALYHNDTLISEGDSVDIRDVLEALNIKLNSYISDHADVCGHFPNSLKEIKDLKDY